MIIIQLIGAFLACVSAAVTLEVPKLLIIKAGLVGTISYLCYLIALPLTGYYIANFIACIVFSLLGHLLARVSKAPVTMFYIPAFFLYVPGTSMYRTALYFIQGDYSQSTSYLIQTLSLAGVIAVGVFLVDSSVDTYYHIKNLYKKKDNLLKN